MDHSLPRPSMPLDRPTVRVAEGYELAREAVTEDAELAPKSAPLAAELGSWLVESLPSPAADDPYVAAGAEYGAEIMYEHTGATPLPELAPPEPEPDPFPEHDGGDQFGLVGRKDDGAKIPLDLLPFDALEEVAKVLQFGAKKYARRNWEKGLPISRVLAATLRHVFAYMRGEDKDPETGFSHLAHAGCEILFALAFECRGRKDLDDRGT
jgi:hypothetical protein